jgi:hypothetical protein
MTFGGPVRAANNRWNTNNISGLRRHTARWEPPWGPRRGRNGAPGGGGGATAGSKRLILSAT